MTTSTTIVGVATGTPDGGVAIVRLSGPAALAIASGLCGALGPARRLVRRSLRLGGAATDDALVVAMPGPDSFTGEDVVELHVHAGRRNVDAVVRACLDAGAVAATAGAFTRRAFEAGRLTLDEAEGIAAIVGAQTEAALAQARRLAAGELGREVEAVGEALLELRAEVEANLDFPEDVEPSALGVGRKDGAKLRLQGLHRHAERERDRDQDSLVLDPDPSDTAARQVRGDLVPPAAVQSDHRGARQGRGGDGIDLVLQRRGGSRAVCGHASRHRTERIGPRRDQVRQVRRCPRGMGRVARRRTDARGHRRGAHRPEPRHRTATPACAS